MRTLAERLKEDTHDLHVAAERHPVHGALFRGERPLADFAHLHAQTALVQLALEARVERSALLREHVRAHHARGAAMLADARRLGAEGTPGETATALIAEIERADDATALGMWYVLEGATNGGRFIAAALARAHGAFECPSLTPHGPAQGERWGAFRAMLDALTLSEDERARVVEGAGRMFRGIIGVLDEVGAARV